MSATISTDFVFEPKVWKDHIAAYFDDKLLFGAVAAIDDTLTAQPGETVNFPFFETIGAVEEPAETDALSVDNLSDDSFTATVKEVGKAVGVKKKAFKVSAARTERIIQEITAQMGRRHAEKIDDDLITEVSLSSSHTVGFTATAAADTMNVRTLMTAKVVAFGDKQDEALAVHMHSLQFLDLTIDTVAGFLKADALDPFFRTPGFQGRLLGMAIFVTDKTPKEGAQIDSKDAYRSFFHKVDPYGFIIKQDLELDADFDILNREWVFASNEWYAVKSFHKKISTLDQKTGALITTVSV